jgi:uncharacterized membrane protein
MNNRDLKGAFVWSLALVLVVIATDNVVIRLVLAAPLLLWLTGHVVLRSIGPIQISLLEHTAYAVGVSIAICVAGGFVLYSISLLTPIGWAVWLVLVTGTALLVGARRRYEWPIPTVKLSSLRREHAIIISVASLITVGAYRLSIHDEANQREFKYTEFWILPNLKVPGKLLVGIKSGEADTQHFDVEVTSDGSVIALWRSIEIGPENTWTHEVKVDPGAYKAEAKLYRPIDHTLYRKVSTFVSAGS